MNELDIVDRLSIHRTMSQYSTIDQLIFALNCDRSAAKKEIESLRKQQAASVPEQAVATVEIGHMLDVLWIDIGWALKNLKGGEKLYLRPVAASVPDELVRTLSDLCSFAVNAISKMHSAGVPLGFLEADIERLLPAAHKLLAAAPSPTGLDNPEAPKPNDKYTFVFPDASMTKIRYIFVDGEMVYENLEPEQ